MFLIATIFTFLSKVVVMGDFEREQARLLQMLEEVPSEAEAEDEADEDEPDSTEERTEGSDTEQELEIDDLEFSEGPRFLGRDKTTKWAKHRPAQTVRTRSKNIVIHLPGVRRPYRNVTSILEIWKLFFPDSVIDNIVQNTNKFIETSQENYKRIRYARKTYRNEILALIGLLYFSGMQKSNHQNAEDLWKTDGTSVELYRLTMSLFRFKFLLRHIRFDDKSTRDARKQIDKLAPIRDLFEEFVSKCKEIYSISEYATIDEKLEAFRGRCGFKQYIPSKPNRYGIKIFALADSKTYYCSNLEVYVGTQPEGPYRMDNSAKSVVERLVAPISGSGRNVTTDRWFTSKELADDLLANHNLTLVGTIRSNRRQIPLEFVAKGLPVGASLFGYQKNATLVSYIPKKNKTVLLLSTLHDDGKIDEESGKPEIIMCYNNTKSGVDVLDKLCASYNCARATNRWPMVVFYSLLNIGAYNSLVVFGANNPNSSIKRRDFLKQLAFELVSDHMKSRATSPYIPRNLKSRIKEVQNIEEEAIQTEDPGIGRCCYCSSKQNRKTRYSCKLCKRFLCLEHVISICQNCYEEGLGD